MALAISKDWILSAYRDHTAQNRAAVPNIIPFKIGAFEGETADGENEEALLTRFAAWNDFERDRALAQLQLTTGQKICQWAGILPLLFGIVLGGPIGLVIGAIIGGLIYFNYRNANAVLALRREELLKNYAEQGESGAAILRGILAEVVDWRMEYESLDGQSQQTIDFLTELHADQFRINMDSDRRIRVQE